jgi:Fe-S-cluster-containing dehydrogenase component
VVQIFDLNLCLICRNCEIHCPKDCLIVDFSEWEATREFRSMVRRMPGQGRS